MTRVPLSPEERILALLRFGYTRREAAFLCCAALHSGFFLRRQYCQFIGKSVGGTAASMIEKLGSARHATVLKGCGNAQVLHLNARPFYSALGEEDNRNRRMRVPLVIKRKLMSLDLVIEFSEGRYLATETEKVGYFESLPGLGRTDLPTKEFRSPTMSDPTNRYFVDKHPIRVLPSGVVTFFFVDEGLAGTERFESFLRQYATLFARLKSYELVYAAESRHLFEQAYRSFERLVGGRSESSPGFDIERLLAHFEDRRLYASGALQSFDRPRLIQFGKDRRTYNGRSVDALYESWCLQGPDAIRASVVPHKPPTVVPRGTFNTHQITHSYDIFGSPTRSYATT